MTSIAKLFVLFVVFVGSWSGYAYINEDSLAVTAKENEKPVDAKALESKILRHLPVGTSLGKTKEYLIKNKHKFNYSEKHKTIFLIERNIMGGGVFAKPALVIEIYFDEGLQISSIKSEVLYTGP